MTIKECNKQIDEKKARLNEMSNNFMEATDREIAQSEIISMIQIADEIADLYNLRRELIALKPRTLMEKVKMRLGL